MTDPTRFDRVAVVHTRQPDGGRGFIEVSVADDGLVRILAERSGQGAFDLRLPRPLAERLVRMLVRAVDGGPQP